MLEIRPNCECCDKDLPENSTEAFICSYECTFCHDCVTTTLNEVCPNCGGGFSARPIRPQTERRTGTSLRHQPASQHRVHTPYSAKEITAFSESIRDISPEKR